MTLGEMFSKELEMEAPASRKCLERMKEDLFDWKPHEKSMPMGYLALLVADIPRWITKAIEDGVIDFRTYEQKKARTGAEYVELFDQNIADAKKALAGAADGSMLETFTLKNGDQILMEMPLGENIVSCLNHWVHHRGQLTVYLRLNDIPVPSIYGPSADDKTF